MNAIYIYRASDNTIAKQQTMEKPNPEDYAVYGAYDQLLDFDGASYEEMCSAYNAHLSEIEASRMVWMGEPLEDGQEVPPFNKQFQKLVDGKGWKLTAQTERFWTHRGVKTRTVAIPRTTSKEDWKEEIYEWERKQADNGGASLVDIVTRIEETVVQPLQKENERLCNWKAEAMQVMPDFQALGKLCGFKLGSNVSEQLMPYIKQLQEQASNGKSNNEHY